MCHETIFAELICLEIVYKAFAVKNTLGRQAIITRRYPE